MLIPKLESAPLAAPVEVPELADVPAAPAVDEPVPAEADPAAPDADVVEFDPVAFAAAWKASKDLVAVGLTAKTIPIAQWLENMFSIFPSKTSLTGELTQSDDSRTREEQSRC